MRYRFATHPHRVTIGFDAALWQRVRAAAESVNPTYPQHGAVVRAAILAADPNPAPYRTGARFAVASRRALRLCSACAGRFDGAPAMRALVADGLNRDWKAQLRRAEMGDAWREVAGGQ